MKKLKRLIIGLIICIIVIIVLISIIIKTSNKNSEGHEGQFEQVDIGKNGIPRTNNIKLYFTIDECINSYFKMIEVNEWEVVLSYLNEEYTKTNNIDKSNIMNKINKYNNYNSYRSYEMYDADGMNFYVKSKIDGKYCFFIVGLDLNNGTFDICPINEDTFNKKIQENENKDRTIAKKIYNFYRNEYINDEELSRKYYLDYIKLMATDPESAYSMLNEEYRKLKFVDINDFKTYINNNKDFLLKTYKVETADSSDFENFMAYDEYINNNSYYKMEGYSVTYNNEYTQYICGNITGSNIVFNSYYPGSYEVYLDSYTCDLPQFLEKYNKSTKENKVAMNLEKIKGALNTKDYRYIYNKLDDTFKKNNFDSLDKLKEYFKNNFFEYNNFDYIEVKLNGNLYSAKIFVEDTTKNNPETKELNVIMRIDDGTNFVMSFSIE